MNTRKAAINTMQSTPATKAFTATPSATALLEEYDYTLEEAIDEGLTGTGANGNITKKDVVQFLAD